MKLLCLLALAQFAVSFYVSGNPVAGGQMLVHKYRTAEVPHVSSLSRIYTPFEQTEKRNSAYERLGRLQKIVFSLNNAAVDIEGLFSTLEDSDSAAMAQGVLSNIKSYLDWSGDVLDKLESGSSRDNLDSSRPNIRPRFLWSQLSSVLNLIANNLTNWGEFLSTGRFPATTSSTSANSSTSTTTPASSSSSAAAASSSSTTPASSSSTTPASSSSTAASSSSSTAASSSSSTTAASSSSTAPSSSTSTSTSTSTPTTASPASSSAAPSG